MERAHRFRIDARRADQCGACRYRRQWLRLRLAAADIVLAGDSCYFCRTLRERRLPRFAYDRAQMHASLDRLAMLEAGGARIFFGHDPEFWKTVPQAPKLIV
jgi:N-acyl homoserine lactone hydrolase